MRLMQETWDLWSSCEIDESHNHDVEHCSNFIMDNKDKYLAVASDLHMPFYVIGCLHYRESSFNFDTFLANGDPLFKDGVGLKTTHVPQGLGPFENWEQAAKASILFRWPHILTMHWDIMNTIQNLTSWNGWGSEMWHDTNSPYVWSFTNKYTSGKYASDGQWDSNLVDAQPGCAAILLSLKAKGIGLNEIKPQEKK